MLKMKGIPKFEKLTWKILCDLIKTNWAESHYYIIPRTSSKEEKNLWLYPLPFNYLRGINVILNPLDKTT